MKREIDILRPEHETIEGDHACIETRRCSHIDNKYLHTVLNAN